MSFGSSYVTLPNFEYLRPKTLQEAMQLLDEHKDEAKILAGGIGLLAFMKERLVDPHWVIDIKAIDELHTLRDEDAKGLTIGATTTMNQILAFEPLKEKYTALRECISLLSDPVLRNRSTLVGDICEALPYVDGPTPLLLFDAEIEAASVKGRRRIPMPEFIKGIAETALEPNELAVAIHLKSPPENTRSVFLKHTSSSEFSVVNLAALCANPAKPENRIVRLAYGALAPTPARVHEVEKVFKSKSPVSQLIDEAVSVVKKSTEPMTDVLAKAEYRAHMLEVMTIKALRGLLGSR